MTITDKQAGKIADWLGYKWSYGLGIELPNGKNVSLGWLYSPEGQGAIMDRMPNNYEIRSWWDDKICLIEITEWTSDGFIARSEGDTRQEALIQAVLQLIEGRDG